MAEEGTTHKQKFKSGEWVKGLDTEGQPIKYGLMARMDPGDGQHLVIVFPERAEDMESDSETWAEAENLEAGEPPDWLHVEPGHALACDWEFNGETQIALMAEPQEVLDRFGDGLSESERKNFRLKLMECVAAGGERVELPGQQSVGVRFLVVGDE